MNSWVLEAIEKAALDRAYRFLATQEPRVLGLDVKQIIELKRYYEANTGLRAQDIVSKT